MTHARAFFSSMLIAILFACAGCDTGSSGSGGGGSATQGTCATQRYSLNPAIACPSAAALATTPGLNGSWLAVTSNGSVYVRDSGGGGGNDHLYRFDSSGVMTDASSLIPGMTYGGDLVALGNAVYVVGSGVVSSAAFSYIYGFNDGDAISSTVLSWQNPSYDSSIGVLDPFTMYIGGNSVGNPIDQVDIVNQKGDVFLNNAPVSKLFVDQSSDRLYSLAGPVIQYVQLGVAGNVQTLATINDPAAGGAKHVLLGDLTTDGNGNLYVTCTVFDSGSFQYSTCSKGSVLMISPDGLTVTPLVSNFNYVANVSYQLSTNQLYMLLANGTSPNVSYAVESMSITPP